MLASSVLPLNESAAHLADVIAVLRDAATSASGAARAQAACTALRAADELHAFALECLESVDVESATGLSTEILLQLEAGRIGSDARMLTKAAATLRTMPKLASGFRAGIISWGQVRVIVAAVKTVRAEGRAAIDELIGAQAALLANQDPDRLITMVDDAVAGQRADLAAKRQERAIDKGFLSIQPRLEGGGSIYAEADADSIATIAQALGAAADAPENPDRGGFTRGQQHLAALVQICEGFLNGSSGGSTRPRPRVLVTMDAKDLTNPSPGGGMRLLWPLPGRPPRLSNVARDMILCDATLVPVVGDGTRPIAVGDAAQVISPKVRAALVARDGGCRFPGCDRPAQWTDAHHIIPGYGNQVEDLALHCRRCHLRIHSQNWRLKLHDDNSITYRRNAKTYTTHPRHRPPPAARE